MKEEYKVVELGDGSKWFVASEITYNDEVYQYMVGLSDNEEEFLDKYQVVKTYTDNNEEYFELVNDNDVLKLVIPLLMPEAKEYIENPSRIEELIAEN